jgi:hypothetical protein
MLANINYSECLGEAESEVTPGPKLRSEVVSLIHSEQINRDLPSLHGTGVPMPRMVRFA